MKKLITIALLIAMCLSLFAGCGEEEQQTTTAATQPAGNMDNAKEYLASMYQTGKKDEPMVLSAAKDVLKSIVIDKVTYTVDWTVAVTAGPAEGVTVGESQTQNHVKLNVPISPSEDILFTATATIKDPNGNTGTVSFNYKVAGAMDAAQVLADAYALESGAVLSYEATLTGKVIKVDQMYDAQYNNITVTIEVEGHADKPVKCYRMVGTGVEELDIGDTIVVTGNITRYNDTVEFANNSSQGMKCELVAIVERGEKAPDDPKQVVDAAFALDKGASLPYTATLTGKVTEIVTAYSEQYGNVTVTMEVEGTTGMKTIECYRMKGEGAESLKVGDTITVSGVLTRYYKEASGDKSELDKIEFGAGCKLSEVVPGDIQGTETPETPENPNVTPETDPAKIMAAAEALAKDQELGYTVNLSGKITTVNTAYDASFKNITVTIAVSGTRSFLMCYRLSGDGVDQLKNGDTITVSGSIKNYNGTIELINGTMTAYTPGIDEGPAEPDVQNETDPTKIVDAAYALETNQTLSYTNTLTGKVTAVKTPYNAEYSNVTVAMVVAGRETKPIVCYRMQGSGADQVKEGDTITVTGNLTNYNGTVQLINGNMTSYTPGVGGTTEKETDAAKILSDAYALSSGGVLSYEATLTGKVISVDEMYNSQFGNVTVTIEVPGYADKPVKCYRMTGTGVDEVDIGYTITVTGNITKYYETVEFANNTNQGMKCELTAIVERGQKAPEDPKQIVDAAFALDKGASLPYTATLTGKVTEIVTAYSDQYKNITVTIEVEGSNGMKAIECYRMKGEGADSLAVGDTITVSGVLTRYYKDATEDKPVLDKIEFGAGCSLDKKA